MNIKGIALSTLAGAVVMFLLGWVIWGILLSGFMDDHVTSYPGLEKEVPDMVLLFISMIFSALLYAVIFNRWASISTFVTGAKAGAVLSLLFGLSMGFFQLSMYNLGDWTMLVVDSVANIVYGAISGGVIAWVLGKVK
jgi:hypothetical protein